VVEVQDDGPGFPLKFLPHAFERFRRADPARSHVPGETGSGLGLTIVERIIADHGGRVEAANHFPHGATGRIILPAHRAIAPSADGRPHGTPVHG
jgi:two-component system, OmpR family, sensor kinase